MQRRDERLSTPWRRAQAKVDAADDELYAASCAERFARVEEDIARFDLYSATEDDLREQVMRLTTENRRLRAENERLREGRSHICTYDSDSE